MGDFFYQMEFVGNKWSNRAKFCIFIIFRCVAYGYGKSSTSRAIKKHVAVQFCSMFIKPLIVDIQLYRLGIKCT